MSFLLQPKNVSCPYCGETFETTIDASVDYQEYIEDCQVCCSPIVFSVSADIDGDVSVIVRGENEA